MVPKIRIGTRGSALALTQTGLVADALKSRFPDLEVELIEIKTIGDRNQGTPLASKGDKRDWIYELELAVAAGEIELAVHSGKDVPADIHPGTTLLSVLPRENPCDIFIGKLLSNGSRLAFADVPSGGVIGTASLRRQAALQSVRNELRFREHRGNVPTRITKLDADPSLSGIVLASAGVNRLKVNGLAAEVLPTQTLLPAINQGILTVQVLSANSAVIDLIKSIQDPDTCAAFEAERGVVSILKGDCHSAVSIYAEVSSGAVEITSKVYMPDGSETISAVRTGAISKAWELGQAVAHELIEKGAERILAASRARSGRAG